MESLAGGEKHMLPIVHILLLDVKKNLTNFKRNENTHEHSSFRTLEKFKSKALPSSNFLTSRKTNPFKRILKSFCYLLKNY